MHTFKNLLLPVFLFLVAALFAGAAAAADSVAVEPTGYPSTKMPGRWEW